MYYQNLLAFSLLAASGSLADPVTTKFHLASTDSKALGLVWPPTPIFACCMYMTTEVEWQGDRLYGCFPPNLCRKQQHKSSQRH
jgi:hypothetical protein